MSASRGHRAHHPRLTGMFVGTNPPSPRWQPACRWAGPGQREVKCQAQNANSSWQAVQKTCSPRLGEPWYFTKSNEHVGQHCRATIGLFKEEIQKAGRRYITGGRECWRAARQTSDQPLLWLFSCFFSLPLSVNPLDWHISIRRSPSRHRCCTLIRQVSALTPWVWPQTLWILLMLPAAGWRFAF